jgi:hypothetical protein
MSYKQIRDRLTVLGPLIDPHIVEGKKNTKFLKDSGRAILDRLIQLEREGHTIKAAKSVIEKELAPNGDSRAGEQSSNGKWLETIIQQLQVRLKEQAEQIAFLQDQQRVFLDQLVELQGQIKLMLPENIERGRRPWWRFW